MEKRNTPVLILSLMWLMAALFSARRLDAQVALGSVTDGSAAVIPEAAPVIRNTIRGALDHTRPADRRA